MKNGFRPFPSVRPINYARDAREKLLQEAVTRLSIVLEKCRLAMESCPACSKKFSDAMAIEKAKDPEDPEDETCTSQ